MIDAPSFADLFRVGRDEALVRQSRLTLATVEREGSDANALVAVAAAIGDEVASDIQALGGDMFIDSAEGVALERLVWDRYGIEKKPAAKAVGSVQFSLPIPAAAGFTIPVGTTLQTTDGKKYETTAAVLFPIGSSGPISASIESLLTGINQQARIGTITSITSTIPGAPTGLTATNTAATAGAANAESDTDLRDRARRFFATARRGTLAAIEAGALNVSGVIRAKAFEVIDTAGRPARYVQLVIADQYTDDLATLTSAVPTYEAQAATLGATVFAALDDVRAAGIYVAVDVARVILQPVKLLLSFAAGVNTAAVADAARAAIVSYMNGLAPGVAFDPLAAVQVLRGVIGLIVTGNDIANPTGPVIPTPLEVLRTSLALVTTELFG